MSSSPDTSPALASSVLGPRFCFPRERRRNDVLVMTPNALLNLLHRGREYMSLKDVGVLVFDECHQARKKHPYARIMAFYMDLKTRGLRVPKVREEPPRRSWRGVNVRPAGDGETGRLSCAPR